MELIEAAYGLNIFSLHVEALAGRLPEWSLVKRFTGLWRAKGIVYAGQSVTIPNTDTWYANSRRDIPFRGDRISVGHPICTVLSRGTHRAECWKNLTDSAGLVRREVGDRLEA
jgi:predicted ATP-grasp superfamily ATP-dependent carboligase